MTVAGFRKAALSLPETAEGAHFGNADFRMGGKIFATLAHEKLGYGNLVLKPEQQAGLCADAPDVFLPVAGGWGRLGATHVRLSKVKKDVLAGLVQIAWRNKASKKILLLADAGDLH